MEMEDVNRDKEPPFGWVNGRDNLQDTGHAGSVIHPDPHARYIDQPESDGDGPIFTLGSNLNA